MATTYSDSIAKVGRHVFGDAATYPIRKIELSDLGEALRLGWEDFKAMPSHAVVVCLIYPVLGIALFRMVLGYSILPLLFPLAAGFALVGPFAAIGLYELSRRREAGVDVAASPKTCRPTFAMLSEYVVAMDAPSRARGSGGQNDTPQSACLRIDVRESRSSRVRQTQFHRKELSRTKLVATCPISLARLASNSTHENSTRGRVNCAR